MAESTQHRKLVEQMSNWVLKEYAHLYALCVTLDMPDSPGSHGPQKIGRHRPDLLAEDVPLTLRVVGEAKTSNFLETRNTQMQILDFLDYLHWTQAETLFLLCVPYKSTPEALLLMRNAIRKINTSTPVCVLGGKKTIRLGISRGSNDA